jgi:protein involved in polysaccharide export with SLBB domain
MAFFGCISVFPGLNAAARAAEPPSAITQSNALATGSIPEARTNATPTTAQPATNRLEAAPITNTAAAATNLSQTSATNSAWVLDDKHKLAIGDRLSFRILEDEEDPKPLFVTDSGDLEVPYIGRVPAENKTCQQLAAEIKTALEKEYYYQATVIIAVDVMTKSHGRVYLVGCVRLPGPVELPSDEVLTLSKAILRAGGFTDYADRRYVKVTRKDVAGKDAVSKEDKKTFVVDVGKIFDKGKIETDLTLEPGDLIFVPDRLFRF